MVDGGTVVIENGILDASNTLPDAPTALALEAQLIAPGAKPIRVALVSEDDRFVIGRDSLQCHAVLDDPMVSRAHAAIGVRNGEPFIEDLNSTNGVFVNRVRIRGSHIVDSGDQIRIGQTEFTYQVSS